MRALQFYCANIVSTIKFNVDSPALLYHTKLYKSGGD